MTQAKETWCLACAKEEISAAAKWARQAGFQNVAPRLEFAARLIQEEINKHRST